MNQSLLSRIKQTFTFRRLPSPGALTCDGWYTSGHTECIDTWVTGFSPEEIEALGGYHTVRAFKGIEPGKEYLEFTVYDDRLEQDILEPVMILDEKGTSRDMEPPGWLQERIRHILPPWKPGDELPD